MTPILEESRERDEDGHLTDTAIAALVDAQPVSAQAAVHAETCEACAARVADSALFAVDLQRGLLDLANLPARAEALPAAPPRARQKSPALYIALALAVAAVASLPTVGSLPGQATGFAAGAKLQLEGWSQIAHALRAEAATPGWSLLLTMIFVISGVLVAVWGSKRERGTKHGFA